MCVFLATLYVLFGWKKQRILKNYNRDSSYGLWGDISVCNLSLSVKLKQKGLLNSFGL